MNSTSAANILTLSQTNTSRPTHVSTKVNHYWSQKFIRPNYPNLSDPDWPVTKFLSKFKIQTTCHVQIKSTSYSGLTIWEQVLRILGSIEVQTNLDIQTTKFAHKKIGLMNNFSLKSHNSSVKNSDIQVEDQSYTWFKANFQDFKSQIWAFIELEHQTFRFQLCHFCQMCNLYKLKFTTTQIFAITTKSHVYFREKHE